MHALHRSQLNATIFLTAQNEINQSISNTPHTKEIHWSHIQEYINAMKFIGQWDKNY